MLKRSAPTVEEEFSRPHDSAYYREAFLTHLEYIDQNLISERLCREEGAILPASLSERWLPEGGGFINMKLLRIMVSGRCERAPVSWLATGARPHPKIVKANLLIV